LLPPPFFKKFLSIWVVFEKGLSAGLPGQKIRVFTLFVLIIFDSGGNLICDAMYVGPHFSCCYGHFIDKNAHFLKNTFWAAAGIKVDGLGAC